MDATLEREKSAQKIDSTTAESQSSHLSTSVIWAKITRWEFWPFSVFYFPIFFYWAWLCLKTRSFFFFTASNPSIEFGGMLGESKKKIFDLIPDTYIPKTFLFSPEASIDQLKNQMEAAELYFPIVLKPDIGERGWMVELIRNEKQLSQYLSEIKVNFLMQEYVPYDLELGVFYYRYPDQQKGRVSSIVMKDMLSVTGDGVHSVAQLMLTDARSKMHLARLQEKSPELLKRIPGQGEKVELVPIGNHCLGTTFLNGNHLINQQLIGVFDHMSKQISGFYFGRYDLRCRSMEDLYQGQHFKIMELNGAGAEPAHIYQPGYSLLQAYKDIIHHLRVLSEISQINQRSGIAYMSLMNGWREIQKIKKYNKQKDPK